MKPKSQSAPVEPDQLLPPEVSAALLRACNLVTWEGGGWAVGGVHAGGSAESLADALYARWYTQPGTPPPPSPEDPPLYRQSLHAAFRAADARAGTLMPGWTVTGSGPHGPISAVKGSSGRMFQPGDYLMPMRPGVPAAPGEPAEAVTRLDHLDAERGFWWAFGDSAPVRPFGRVYLNARPATAARAIHEVTKALLGMPFQLKCPVLAIACQRVDAIVLYHERAARDGILAALLERWSHLGPLLDSAVPPLTCPIRPGLAWADDIDEARSYGEHRCHEIASAITGAAATWMAIDAPEQMAVLVTALRAAGIDPQRPWSIEK